MSAEKLRELKTLASVCPELNMANYTEDDVRHLNDWAIEMSLLVEQYALSQQPDNAACKSVQKRLEAQQPATSEPDEWKLVPIVPTEDMLLAYTGGAVTNAGFSWCKHQWSAMLAATPAAHAAHPASTVPIQKAEAQQPATGEPVAPYTVIKDTSDSPLSKRVSKLIEMVFHYGKQNLSGVDDEISAISREIAKLESRVNRPAPSVPADVVRDAISTVREHYRGTDWGKAAESICDAIDAAMLAAEEKL